MKGIELTTRTASLISPYGGELVDLQSDPAEVEDLKSYAVRLPSIQVSPRTVCDLEMLAVGGFSPLSKFMGAQDYHRVIHEMRLQDGHIFPVPVTLPVSKDVGLSLDSEIALRDSGNNLLAVMRVEEIFEWDLIDESELVFGTSDPRHPLVAEMHRWGKLNISGRLKLVDLPVHNDHRSLRLNPRATRAQLRSMGRADVVAFQTRNPLHRVHEEMTRRASEQVGGTLLLHPVVGMTKPGDIDHFTRVRTYKALAERYYEPGQVLLALLPLAMRLAGPREALWHAVIRRNYGANHLIVGRNHASPGEDSSGQPFYGPYEAQRLVERFSDELGVGVIPFHELVYLPEQDTYVEASRVPEEALTTSISGTQVREDYLSNGRPLPNWFTRPEVAEILAEAYPPRHKQGVCIWFTGLSGSGKSTTAQILTTLIQEKGRQVTLLDGDVVRTHLSKGLGFSKEDRDTNIRRIGYVASEIVRHGGVVICSAISPYRAARNDVRGMVGNDHFIEIYVDTPLEVCEARDTKGLYAKARRGEIEGFTGIDDPYEVPENPECRIETVDRSALENSSLLIDLLTEQGFLRSDF